jgi:2-(1,2-epoxy-1,2-dihydrophenyl)acetyl-CoA isomerase
VTTPVRIEHDPITGVCELVLNRPEAGNAVDLRLADALLTGAARCQQDDVRVVLLRAEGPNFCVGGDIRAFVDGDPSTAIRRLADRFHDALRTLGEVPVPVIAAAQGWAAGAGFSLALAADLLQLADGARFKAAYGGLGLTPDGGLTWHLTRRLPQAIANDLLLSDRVLDADEALAHGLASHVHPTADLTERARSRARTLAARSRTAATRTKALLRASRGNDLSTQLNLEAANIAEAAAEPDGREGVTAFVERRHPQFTMPTASPEA